MKTATAKIKTLEFIKNSDGISRVELAKELDITPAGIGKIVNGFLKRGIIKEYSEIIVRFHGRPCGCGKSQQSPPFVRCI